jgi:hypothetical protein
MSHVATTHWTRRDLLSEAWLNGRRTPGPTIGPRRYGIQGAKRRGKSWRTTTADPGQSGGSISQRPLDQKRKPTKTVSVKVGPAHIALNESVEPATRAALIVVRLRRCARGEN